MVSEWHEAIYEIKKTSCKNMRNSEETKKQAV